MLSRARNMDRSYAFDASRVQSPDEAILAARHLARSATFDAAGSGGFAFLASQLEYPNVDLVKPLASVTHARDIPVKTGGGYVEFTSNWASEYATTGGNQYGLQGTQNTDIPMVQVNIKKGIWPANNWQNSMSVSYIDLKRLADAKVNGIPAPYSLQALLDEGVKVNWGKALDFVTYKGWLGQPGLLNNPNVASVEAAETGSGSGAARALWANKTQVEILVDINNALIYTQKHSGYDIEGMANTILLDYENWSLLNAPMTNGGFNSILEYVLANNVARRQGVDLEILPLADDWIDGVGPGGTNIMLAYVKSEKSLRLQIPQPIQKIMTVPSVSMGGSYQSIFSACIGVVQWLRPTTAVVVYGI